MTVPISFLPKLESNYAAMRAVQASHDESPYRCIGSGKCCRIGLRIPLAECYSIAQGLKRQLFIQAEKDGLEKAQENYKATIKRLIERMYDQSWKTNGESELLCAFFDKGCSIYEFRPMVCRAYGTIMPVSVECPRARAQDGSHDIFHDEQIENLIDDFEESLSIFTDSEPDSNYSVYMPTGVLRYLLPHKELESLAQKTDNKFWTGIEGYPHNFRPENWIQDAPIANMLTDSTDGL